MVFKFAHTLWSDYLTLKKYEHFHSKVGVGMAIRTWSAGSACRPAEKTWCQL